MGWTGRDGAGTRPACGTLPSWAKATPDTCTCCGCPFGKSSLPTGSPGLTLSSRAWGPVGAAKGGHTQQTQDL